ncbi:hypothetical protein AMECASPLE_015300 [Ameca splendens]|uniref:Uncharacterized protein n=1 Tax=Ameca splendens TaxID=208324 RepID=A0ABV1A0L1_9TELE
MLIPAASFVQYSKSIHTKLLSYINHIKQLYRQKVKQQIEFHLYNFKGHLRVWHLKISPPASSTQTAAAAAVNARMSHLSRTFGDDSLPGSLTKQRVGIS